MSLIRYRAYPFVSLQQISRMFDEFDRTFSEAGEGSSSGLFAPAMDVKEDAESYVVHLEVPGVKQDDLSLTLQEGTLVVRGQKAPKRDSNSGQARRIERSYGSFARAVTLPRPVDANAVAAHLEDGVLEIRLPKTDAAKPRQITIGATQNIMAIDTNSANDSQPGAHSDAQPSNQELGTTSDPTSPIPEAPNDAPSPEAAGDAPTGEAGSVPT